MVLFSIKVKEISLSYHVEKVFADIPTLQHGNDGLIYTCVNTAYSPGTDTNMRVYGSETCRCFLADLLLVQSKMETAVRKLN